jgi:hypothetical protein
MWNRGHRVVSLRHGGVVFRWHIFIGIADWWSLGCSELCLKSQKFLAAVHLVDSKRHDINQPVAPEALVAQTVTKAPARLHLSHQRSVSRLMAASSPSRAHKLRG